MWIVGRKRWTFKQQLSSSLSQAQLDLLPDSSFLVITPGYTQSKSFGEEESGVKGVLRSYDQEVVVSVCQVSLLTPFFSSVCPPQAVENIYSFMEHLFFWPWDFFYCFSLFFLLLFSLPGIFILLKYIFPEVSLAVHKLRTVSGLFWKGHPCSLPAAKPGHKHPIQEVLY